MGTLASILLAFIGGMLVYGLTYLSVKERANPLPAGALVGSLVLSPWYLVMPAALFGHLAGIWLLKFVFQLRNKG
ncbi:hypothetical protein F0267_01660 [Vibrio coralliilyticus]|uniref:Uncharacterized protein n=1 Tax=Vibrio coralliilyticus TaxID=190893 RepID=A0AAN0SJE2_9VIBR|nr:hypothetical protein [Vibrio coralliilyticus]AIW22376.1 hypothetical protein IX92_25230 [Vibrio coralliilyticus]NOH36930.1 hypothetical protein [Vibrio coralliilyticus]